MKTILLIHTLLFTCLYTSWAQSTVYEKADSIKVVKLLTEAPVLVETADYMIYFGGKLKGTPYVAKTLEVGNEENLIVNMSGMDCTTALRTRSTLSMISRTFYGGYVMPKGRSHTARGCITSRHG